MQNKVAEFMNESPHRSGKGTPKFLTPKSLCFIHQKESQELPRTSARFKDRMTQD